MEWEKMFKQHKEKKLDTSVCDNLADKIKKAGLFDDKANGINGLYTPLKTAIKEGQLGKVKELLGLYKWLEGCGNIAKSGYPCDIIKNLQGDSNYMKGEPFGAIWWLTFQSSNYAHKPTKFEKGVISKAKKMRKDKKSFKEVFSYMFEQIIGDDKWKSCFSQYRQIYRVLKEFLSVKDGKSYGKENLPIEMNVTELQCVNMILSKDFQKIKSLKEGLDGTKLPDWSISKFMVSIANTIDFAMKRYKDRSFEKILDELESSFDHSKKYKFASTTDE